MKKPVLLLILLLGVTLSSAWGQSQPVPREPVLKIAGQTPPGSRAALVAKGAPKPPSMYAPTIAQRVSGEVSVTVPVVMSKIKLKKPVLVYYQEPAPGKAVQQLIMAEESLSLLKTMDLEHLMTRREVFVDGLGNRALPGSDATKFRLLGTSVVVEDTRRAAGDGRSFYSRLKVSSSSFLYVVLESAEEYRHFVKGPQATGSLLDFQFNGLPGVDSVRAMYTLRKINSSERGTGGSEIIR